MKFMVFDTEDDSKGSVFWINFFDGRKHFSFCERAGAVEYLKSISRFRMRIFAVNLEYDLVNTFGINDLIEQVELFYVESRLIKGVMGKIIFLDTLNHWKIGVKLMGEQLKKIGYENMEKMELAPESLEYCKRDCEVTFWYVYEMLKKYSKAGIPFKNTLGETSLNYYKRKFGRNVLANKIETKWLDYFKNFYFGGRTECFKIGEIQSNKKDIHCFDVNSLYPFCMLNDYPNPFIFERTNSLPVNEFYLAHCLIESDLELPVFPKRNGRLLFPNGIFEVFTNSVELKKFLELGGYIIDIYDVIKFPYSFVPFDKFVLKLYKMRQNTDNIFEKIIYKLLMNNLYGKFGQDRMRTLIMKTEEFVEQRKSLVYKKALPIFDNEYTVVTVQDTDYPYQTNMIWSLFVTAYGRVQLYNEIEKFKAAGNAVFYTDTDSIIYQGKLMPVNDELGGMKREWSTNYLYIRNLKEYFYNGESGIVYKAKGVNTRDIKKLKQFFETGKVEIEKPVRLRQSLRSVKEELKTANKWVLQQRESTGEYMKGIVQDDGNVLPFVFDEISEAYEQQEKSQYPVILKKNIKELWGIFYNANIDLVDNLYAVTDLQDYYAKRTGKIIPVYDRDESYTQLLKKCVYILLKQYAGESVSELKKSNFNQEFISNFLHFFLAN